MHTDANAAGSTSAVRPDLEALAGLVAHKSSVLDLGCGEGELLEYLTAAKDVRGRGIELHEEGVLACIRKGLSVRQGNLHEGLEDYLDQSVDYVILSQTLHLLNMPSRVVSEMLRVGRRSIVSIPNWGHWRCRLELLFGGRVSEAPVLQSKWTTDKRWQAMTLGGFQDFCRKQEVSVEQRIFLGANGASRPASAANLLAATGIFVLRPNSRNQD